MSALAAEIGRTSTARRPFTDRIKRIIDALASGLSWTSPATQQEQAISFLATAVGALVLARAVDDPLLSRSILDAARRQLSVG